MHVYVNADVHSTLNTCAVSKEFVCHPLHSSTYMSMIMIGLWENE